jgi:putative transposase
VREIVDLETIVGREYPTNTPVVLKIKDLVAAEAPSSTQNESALETIGEAAWTQARQRLAAIAPILGTESSSPQAVRARAAELGLHQATLYRWIKAYTAGGTLQSLIPSPPGPNKGSKRLRDDVEAILEATIEEFYLSKQKPSIKATCDEVRLRCRRAGVRAPHYKTVLDRVQALRASEVLPRRDGRRGARRVAPLRGSFPGAEFPLSVVQIDHTKLDVILVDPVQRKAVGRPWITLAIDVYSRMVTGFYVAFEHPAAHSVGLCVAHSILPKEASLAAHGVSGEWPIWGIPRALHLDNAREFHSRDLSLACENYGIDLHYRPVAQPHFGGHIERLVGTLNREIHRLPGSTFSNPGDRGEYRSAEQASLTLEEFEEWLTRVVVEVYHRRNHAALGMSPLERWRDGILGSAERPGVGLPDLPLDPDRLRIDFLPFEKRTVQAYGISWDGIYYFADVLRPWIIAGDPRAPRQRQTFIVRRDPRDISCVYFWDPELKQYYRIPYRNTGAPAMSVWELRKARKDAQERSGARAVEETAIFEAFERLRSLEEKAVQTTRAVRRAPARGVRPQRLTAAPPERASSPALDYGPIEPFEDREALR